MHLFFSNFVNADSLLHARHKRNKLISSKDSDVLDTTDHEQPRRKKPVPRFFGEYENQDISRNVFTMSAFYYCYCVFNIF